MAHDYKNRCWGCHHYGGIFKGGCENGITIFEIGHRGVFASGGCSDFQADYAAACRTCYYHTSKDRYTCSVYNISKAFLGSYFPGADGYCSSFAQRESCHDVEKKSGCFVTTAVYEILGKDDNCYELEVLRKFRDTKLLTDEDLKDLVHQYYEISPRLVNIIKSHPSQKEFSQYLLNHYIQNIIVAIESDKDMEAISLYQEMLVFIESQTR